MLSAVLEILPTSSFLTLVTIMVPIMGSPWVAAKLFLIRKRNQSIFSLDPLKLGAGIDKMYYV